MKPKPNIDAAGRVIRLVIAIALLVAAWWAGSWILLALSLFTFYEALFSWCVIYQLLGKNSCKLKGQ